jgi:transposase
VIPFFTKLPPCLIGMEACGTSHHWARELAGLGHEVRLMPPAYVKPYVKRGKTDAGDAEAICEAVTRPTMRFVPIKRIEPQDLQALHRVRERLIKARTALVKEIRGLLHEYGMVKPRHNRLCWLMRRGQSQRLYSPSIALKPAVVVMQGGET